MLFSGYKKVYERLLIYYNPLVKFNLNANCVRCAHYLITVVGHPLCSCQTLVGFSVQGGMGVVVWAVSVLVGGVGYVPVSCLS